MGQKFPRVTEDFANFSAFAQTICCGHAITIFL